MSVRKYKYCVLASIVLASSPAFAQQTVTTLDGSQGWQAPPTELRNNATSSSDVTISSNSSLDADGSLALSGERTRVLTGDNYGATTNFGSANSLVSLTGDYLVLDGGNGGIQSPAFRIYIQDGAARSELIWEAAYNGGYTLGAADSAGATDLFWQFLAGCGYVGTAGCGAGSYVMHTAEAWGDLFSSNAFITGFGVGNGSGSGNGFSALADNLVLTTTAGAQSVNFAAAAPVPEPGTWAMMLMGFGAVGFSIRKTRKARAVLQIV